MLESFTLKFTENDALTLPAKGITILVGPNNSGKSLALKELEQVFKNQKFPADLKILQDYEITWPTRDEVVASFDKYAPLQRKGMSAENIIVGSISPNGNIETTELKKNTILNNVDSKNNKSWWSSQILRWGLIRLDGRSRFNLTNDQGAGNLTESPQNVLAKLFKEDDNRKKVNDIVFEAFKLYFVVDPTNLGQFRIKLSQEKPPVEERSLNDRAIKFYDSAIYIRDASDGVQAFTGIVTAVISEEYHTILIDEPEAFLHPPLARKLGKHLAKLVTDREGALLASTHSADFLMGCVQASKDVQVVRLEYGQGKSRGRVVDPVQLEKFFKHPLMRSANVISGLFYDGVIVTESDNDRAFYSEIYARMAENREDFPSILFVNAQNKQTIIEIIGPLRLFGVPAAAIPDIDIIKDGGATWTGWLRAAQIPEALHIGYGTQRSTIKSRLEATGKNMKTEGGLAILNASDALAAHQLFDNISEYGIFPVRHGEVENWLPMLEVCGKKTDWAVAMLERLGGDPSDSQYVRPATGDVWDFMDGIVNWIRNPSRKGTP